MNIANATVVRFHYTLKNANGEVMETSRDGDALAYLHGRRNIIPGLEEALEGKAAGDRLTVTVPQEKGYGPRHEDQLHRLPLKRLQGAKVWKPGMMAMVQTQHGPRQVRVLKVGRFNADVDFNHPLAGQTLIFDIEVLDVRAATPEELEHGHAHGAGGHHH